MMNTTKASIQFMNDEIFVDPYKTFSLLRRQEPVHWIPEIKAWFVSRYEDAVVVLHDDEHFSKTDTILSRNMHPTVRQLFATMHQDDPNHRRIRSVLQKFFSLRDLRGFEEEIQTIVDRTVAGMEEGKEIDLMKEYAYRIPIEVLSIILGLPEEDYPLFESWAPGLVKGFNPDPTSENWRVGAQTYTEVREYLIEFLKRTRGMPSKRPTIFSLLIDACDAGTISEDELYSQAVVLYVGSHETTLNLIGLTVYNLLRAPEEMVKLKGDLSLLGSAVEETARFDGPGHMVERRVKKATSLQGVVLKEDDAILVGTASANRDPQCCENPDQFIIDRGARVDHVGWGHGIHFCLGVHLARLEARIAVGALIERFPNMELAEPAPLAYAENIILHGLKRLPVRL